MVPWVVLWMIGWMSSTARGFSILSQIEDVYLVDGVPNTLNSVVPLCLEGDFDVTHDFTVRDSSGVIHAVNFTCDSIGYDFTILIRGYVAEDGTYQKVRQGIVRDLARFTGKNLSQPLDTDVYGNDGQVLQSIDDDVRQLLQVNAELNEDSCNQAFFLVEELGRKYGWENISRDEISSRAGLDVSYSKFDVLSERKCTTISSSPSVGTTINLLLYSTPDTCDDSLHLRTCNPSPWISSRIADAAACIGSTNRYASDLNLYGGSCDKPGTPISDGNGNMVFPNCVPHSCFGGPTADDLTKLKTTGDALRNDVSKVNTSLSKTLLAQSRALTDLGNFTNELVGYAEGYNTTITNLVLSATAQFESNKMQRETFNRNLATRHIQIQNATDVLRSLNVQLLAESQAVQDTSRQFMFTLSGFSVNVSNEMVDLGTQLQVNEGAIRGQLRATQQLIIGNYGVFFQVVQKADIATGLNAQIQKVMADREKYPAYSGGFYTPFLNYLGTAPADDPSRLPDAIAYVPPSDVSFKYITGTNTGRLTRLQLQCDTNWFVKRAPISSIGARDIYSFVGIFGCDPTRTGARSNYTCTCFVRVSDSRCVLPTNPTNTQIQTFLTDTRTIDAGCAAPAATDALDGTYNTDVDDIAATFEILSRRGLRNGTTYYASSSIPVAPYSIPYSALVNNRTNFMTLAEKYSNLPSSLVYVWSRFIELEWSMVYETLVTEYRAVIDGILPAKLDQHVSMYRRWSNTTTGPAYTLGYMQYTDNFLTAASLTPAGVTTNVQVTVDNVTSTVSDVSFTSPFQFLLRALDSMIYSPSLFGSRVYDMPFSATNNYSPYPGERKGTGVYNIASDLSLFDIDSWEAINKREFVHEWATNVPWPYLRERVTDPDDIRFGRCTATARIPGGPWCDLLENFRMVLVGDTLRLFARHQTMQAKVQIPAGPLARVLSATCPVTQQLAVSANSLNFRLFNPGVSDAEITVTQVGLCPEVRTVTIDAGGYKDVTAFSCALAPVESPDFIILSYLNPSLTQTQCPGTITLSYKSQTAAQFVDPMSANLTRQVAQTSQDVTLVAIETMRFTVLTAIVTAATTIYQSHSFGFQIGNGTSDSYNDLIAAARALATRAREQADEAGRNKVDIDSILADLDAAIDQAEQNLADSIAANRVRQTAVEEAYQRAYKSVSVAIALSSASVGDIGQLATDFEPYGYAITEIIKASVDKNENSEWAGYVSGNEDGFETPESPWNKVGRFITSLPEKGGELIKGFFEDPLAFLSGFLSPGSNTKGIAMMVFFVAFTAALLWMLVTLCQRYARKRVYLGDKKAAELLSAMLRGQSVDLSDDTAPLMTDAASSSSSADYPLDTM